MQIQPKRGFAMNSLRCKNCFRIQIPYAKIKQICLVRNYLCQCQIPMQLEKLKIERILEEKQEFLGFETLYFPCLVSFPWILLGKGGGFVPTKHDYVIIIPLKHEKLKAKKLCYSCFKQFLMKTRHFTIWYHKTKCFLLNFGRECIFSFLKILPIS